MDFNTFTFYFFSGKQQKVGSVRIGNAKLSDGPGVLKTSGQLPRSSSNSSKGFQIYQETENNPPPSTSGELWDSAIFFSNLAYILHTALGINYYVNFLEGIGSNR